MLRKTTVVILAAALMSAFGFAAPASADWPSTWWCEKSSGKDPNHSGAEWYRVKCGRDDGSGYIDATFFNYGEWLYITDMFPNDHHTYAYVGIRTSNPYTITRHTGENYEGFNLDLAEGTDISLKVCTSAEPGRVCSDPIYGDA